MSSAGKVAPKNRLDLLDLYRGIAILLVVVFHYTARYPVEFMGYSAQPVGLPWGHFGVELFFAISGFCIAMTAAGTRSAAQFLARRVSRIYPAFFFATIVTFVILTALPTPGMTVSLKDLVGNWLFLGNMGVRWVDGAYWSLAVEMRFYLLFAIAFYRPKWVLPCLAGVAAVYGASALFLLSKDRLVYDSWMAFAPVKLLNSLLIFEHVPWFLLGIGLYWLHTEGYQKRVGLILAASLVWMTGLVFAYRLVGHAVAYALVVFAMSLVVLLPNVRVPKWVTFVGAISYPLYLLHQNIGVAVIRQLSGIDDYLKMAIGLAVVTVLTLALHYGVEFRYRRRLDAFIVRNLGRLAAFGASVKAALPQRRLAPTEALVEVPVEPDSIASRVELR